MSFDDDIRSRIGSATPDIGDLGVGAQAVDAAAHRRSLAQRVAVAGSAVIVLLVGLVAISLLRNDDQTDIRTADDPIEVPTSVPEPTTPAPKPTTPAPAGVTGTAAGIVTVDIDGIVRVNGEIIDPGEFQRPGVPFDDIVITAVDGAGGTLIYQTSDGVFKDGALWHRANDAVVHDVIEDDLRTLIGWQIPAGNDPSGNVLGQWTDPAETKPTPFLEYDADAASYGPSQAMLITSDVDGCSRHVAIHANGELIDDHPINQLSRCLPGEIAEWSTAGHVVLVAPTQEDAWTITVLAADGESAQLTSPGAFQPKQLDVYTDSSGRTQALVLGTGEELVYIDVDAFLREPAPELAVRGISNGQNLVSARFVSGFAQHPYQAQVDEVIAGHEEVPDTTTQASVWNVVGVDSDDTLNARSGPGTQFDVRFEFAPNATGVVSTGVTANSDDGGEWLEVFTPTSGTEFDVGWVNGAFLVETSVPDARPCLFNGPQDHYIGIDWTNPDGSANSEAAVISNIETYRFGGCLRTVIEFSDGWSYEDGGANRVTALPTDILVLRDNSPTIDFGSSIVGAEVAEARFDEQGGVSQSMFVSLGADRQLDGLIYGPTTTMTATFDNTSGTMIIDIADIRLSADADPTEFDRVGPELSPIFDDAGLVLTGVMSNPDGTEWTFTGLARPFEATLGVAVQKTDGTPVEVAWRGGVVDGARSANGVMTTAYIDAWGQFSFTITLADDVDPADVVIMFDPSGGGADDVQTVDLLLADHLG